MNRPTPPVAAYKGVGTDSKQYPGNSAKKIGTTFTIAYTSFCYTNNGKTENHFT